MKKRVISFLMAVLAIAILLPAKAWAEDVIPVRSLPASKQFSCAKDGGIIPADCYISEDGNYYIADDQGSILLSDSNGIFTGRSALVFPSELTDSPDLAEVVSPAHIMLLCEEDVPYTDPTTGRVWPSDVNLYVCALCNNYFYGSDYEVTILEEAIPYSCSYAQSLIKANLVRIPDNAQLCDCAYLWNVPTAESDTIKWSLDDSGTLTICGSGAMPDYTYYTPAPWHERTGDIKRVVIEDGVTRIGNNAFVLCRSLQTVTIPGSVKSIGEDAFNGCEALTSVSLGEGVSVIETGAFSYCDKLCQITIPASVMTIAPKAFAGCTQLTLDVAAGNNHFVCVDNVLFSKDMTELVLCSNKKGGSYTVPDGVTSIADSAFFYCVDLNNITIPDSVTSIGNDAFNQCDLLEMTLPAGLTSISDTLFWSNFHLTRVVIPDGVTSIGYCAFSNCEALRDIYLPRSVETISAYAFTGCFALKSIALPTGLKTINEYAFNHCTALEEVVISNPDMSVAANSFEGCTSLRSVYFAGDNARWERWKSDNQITDAANALSHAKVTENFERGNLNGQGSKPDASDVQCMYTYLTSGEMLGKYKDSDVAFKAAADMNNDGSVDVYDLQQLYENVILHT